MKMNTGFWGLALIFTTTISAGDGKKPRSCGRPIFDPPKERALYLKASDWKAGQIIKVYFLNGTDMERGVVEHYAREWEKYGNFKFEFHQERKTQNENTILIKFEPQPPGVAGSSSLGHGTESIDVRTMSLAPGMRNEGTILHEFGHALGFGHEQDNPAGASDWIPEVAYKYFGELYQWDKKTVDEEVLNRLTTEKYDWTAFDRHSTMAYEFPPELFKSGRLLGRRFFLSAGDKEAIAKMYPGRTPPVDQVPTWLYFADEGNVLTAGAKNGVMQLLIDDVVVKEIQVGADMNAVDLNFDSYVKSTRTKVGYKFVPSAPDYFVSVRITHKKWGNIFTWGCIPEMQCGTTNTVPPFSVYLTHLRNFNRGQDIPDPVIVQPVIVPTEEKYSDLAGDITINGDLGPKLLNAILQRNSVEVRRLLSNGADPNAVYQGWTALMLAAYLGEKDITRMLIVRKADIERKFGDYWTAYLIARKANNVDVMEILSKAGAKGRMSGIEKRTMPTLQ